MSLSSVNILYKGKLLGICTVIIYTLDSDSTIIHYELRDDVKYLPVKSNLINIKLVSSKGAFTVQEISSDPAELIEELLAQLEFHYTSTTLDLYKQELTYAKH